MAEPRAPHDDLTPDPVRRHGSSRAPAEFLRGRRRKDPDDDRAALGDPGSYDAGHDGAEAARGSRGRSGRFPADTSGPMLQSWPGPDLGDRVHDGARDPLPGPDPRAYAVARRKLGKALVPGETILVAQTRHPVVVLEPVTTSLLVLLGIAAVSPRLGDLDLVRGALMLGWLVLAVRALWRWLCWANDYLVVTDRRLLRLHGVIDTKRDMMPLMKVTDMAFRRPFLGRWLHYGTFVLESAGRDQALREIRYVRRPDVVDAIIGRQIFARPPSPPPR